MFWMLILWGSVFLTFGTLIHEREWRGLFRSILLFSPILILTGFYPVWPDFFGLPKPLVFLLPILFFIWILLPLRPKLNLNIMETQSRIDERDALFHRFYKLQPDTPEWHVYYSKHPEKIAQDARLREMPGLQEPGCKTYHPETSPFSLSIFDTIERLNLELDGQNPVPPELVPVTINPDRITARLKGFARHLGAELVGTTRLNPAYVYSHLARGQGQWGDPIDLSHTWALVIGVRMSHAMFHAAPGNTVITESAAKYLDAAKIAVTLSRYLQRLGYQARAHVDGNYQLLCVPVAVDAGLGELGRHGMLIHPRFGSMIRLAVVSTSLELKQDSPLHFGVQNFCASCLKCADNCPSGAVDAGEKQIIAGTEKWQTDQDACYRFWRHQGTDCGLCIRVCPYSHPDTLLHTGIRGLLRHNKLLHKPALILDNLVYGRKRIRTKQETPEWHRS